MQMRRGIICSNRIRKHTEKEQELSQVQNGYRMKKVHILFSIEKEIADRIQ